MTQLKLEVTLEDRVEGGDNNKISIPITIIVVDENDNKPKFERVSEQRMAPPAGVSVLPCKR